MKRLRLLLRHPAFVLSIWLGGGVALAVGIALAGLFRLRPGWPPALEAVTMPGVTPDVAWRLAWSPAAVTPASAGARGVEGLLGGFSGLAALCVLVALVNVAAMLAARRSRERRDRAIRLSLGASARDLARYQARRGRFLNAGAAVVGVAIGLIAILAMRMTWPDGLRQPGSAWVLPGLVISGFVLLSFLPRRGGGTGIDFHLLAGRNVSGDQGGSRLRARIAGIQFAIAVTIIATAGALLRSAPDTSSRESSGLHAPGRLGLDLALAGDTPTVARAALFGALLEQDGMAATAPAETIASPGAWLGVGVQDNVMVECGTCFRGGMLLPVQTAFVTHHMVSSGFVEALGIELVAGRTISADDGPETERVAMVNEAFARDSFERGRPIGKRVQVGGLRGDWYTVVGVVRDRTIPGLGAPREDGPALYLSVQQEPPFAVTVTPSGTDVDRATARLKQAMAGLDIDGSLGPATTLRQAAVRNASPLHWFTSLYTALASLAFLLAIAGVGGLVHEAIGALQRQLAIRAALGGRFRHLSRAILGEAVRTILLGTGLGLMGAFTAGRLVHMREPAVRTLDAATFLTICLVLSVVVVATALVASRRIARGESARLLSAE